MPNKLSLGLVLLSLASLAPADAAGRKPKLTISFHLEGEQHDGAKMVQPIKLGNPPQTYYFRRAPELTQRHIRGYYPFMANDGSSWGAAFKLNSAGSDTLTTISTAGLGRKLLTVINAEPIDFVVLDSPIRDGYIVVWGGLTKKDLALFDRKFVRIQPARSDAGESRPLVPERATSKKEAAPPPLKIDEADAPKQRRRLLPFRRKNKKNS